VGEGWFKGGRDGSCVNLSCMGESKKTGLMHYGTPSPMRKGALTFSCSRTLPQVFRSFLLYAPWHAKTGGERTGVDPQTGRRKVPTKSGQLMTNDLLSIGRTRTLSWSNKVVASFKAIIPIISKLYL